MQLSLVLSGNFLPAAVVMQTQVLAGSNQRNPVPVLHSNFFHSGRGTCDL